jgi:hypothetical protein
VRGGAAANMSKPFPDGGVARGRPTGGRHAA